MGHQNHNRVFFRAGIEVSLDNICPVTAEGTEEEAAADLKGSDLSLEFVRNKIGSQLIVYINRINDSAESRVRQTNKISPQPNHTTYWVQRQLPNLPHKIVFDTLLKIQAVNRSKYF